MKHQTLDRIVFWIGVGIVLVGGVYFIHQKIKQHDRQVCAKQAVTQIDSLRCAIRYQ